MAQLSDQKQKIYVFNQYKISINSLIRKIKSDENQPSEREKLNSFTDPPLNEVPSLKELAELSIFKSKIQEDPVYLLVEKERNGFLLLR
jgi:hypothetical protein